MQTLTAIRNELLALKDEKMASKQKRIPQGMTSFGIKLGSLRSIAKQIGISHPYAKELINSSIYDEVMLGLMLEDVKQLSPQEMTDLAKRCNSSMLVDSALIDLAIAHKDSSMLMKSWVESTDNDLIYAGVTWLSSYFRLSALETIDKDWSLKWLNSVIKTLNHQPLAIQNAMNNAVVMAGLHVPELHLTAVEVAAKIGHIMPLVAKNSCNIQSASDYLERYITQPAFSRIAKLNNRS